MGVLSPAGPWLNSAEEISFGLGNDLCRGALIVDARQRATGNGQRRWFSNTPSIDSISQPPRRATLPLGDLTCFRTRDSKERKEGKKSNSRACVRTPQSEQYWVCTTRVRKSLKGLAPSFVVYAASQGTAPCTCWSSRQTAAAIRYPGFLPRNTSPWIKHARNAHVAKCRLVDTRIGDGVLFLEHRWYAAVFSFFININ